MLGELLGSEQGHTTGRRVLPVDDFRYVKLEVSFESETRFRSFGSISLSL